FSTRPSWNSVARRSANDGSFFFANTTAGSKTDELLARLVESHHDQTIEQKCLGCGLLNNWDTLLAASSNSNNCSQASRVHSNLMVASGCLLISVVSVLAQTPQTIDWPRVGNDPGCMRYSQLDQINRDNVRRLKPAWTYHTKELEGRTGKTI